ncbi:RsmB/NOP family methyltransferase [Corallococcus coralloides]|uniref:RsmB/NOP family methyltransferase n=1 Tax=Corallococcus coralloides TaxID=184914 RepID=A0A410RUS6_CORCK|nr:RsmB/NOP family class I SAM-dependent RNA methyltransferase [Corallococcus coralloides]QAT85638.1 RsmB/NOP family methyltransferase [Corallococcus coralloides]
MDIPLWPTPHEPSRLGRPSRRAATAAVETHIAVLKGEPLKAALATALREAEGLGGQERRFVALAARELSRHTRLLDLAARQLGHSPGKHALTEDQALVRYTLWRRLFCGEGWARIGPEVKLPGPVRPRTLHDAVLEGLVTKPLAEPAAAEGAEAVVERLATRYSFPGWLTQRLAQVCPEATLAGLMASLDEEPSLHFRARPPGTRDAVLAALAEEGVAVEAVPGAPDALRVADSSHRIFESRTMKARRLQVQDVGSQLIVLACLPPGATLEGLTVADVCAGAGGKTLGLADLVGAKGKVLAGDRSKRRLADARDRVREFGLKQVAFPHPVPLDAVDVVLVDAPCSGTGSLAREPDQKWKLSAKAITEFQATQSQLLAQVAAQVKPGARIVYATCSVLPEENDAVVEGFLAKHPGFALEPVGEGWPAELQVGVDGPYLRALPPRVPGGGFFAARLVRKAG